MPERPHSVEADPTVEVDLCTSNVLFRAAVSSGTSTGVCEALEFGDNDKTCYMGKGVSRAVEHINKTIAPALISKKLSVANAILGVTLAVCKAAAVEKGVPLYLHIADLADNSEVILPVAAFNVINSNSHAGNTLAMQKFMILPVHGKNFREALSIGVELYHNLKNVIKKKYGKDATNVGDEGGVDVAASEFSGQGNMTWTSSCLMTPAARQRFTASAGIQVVGNDLIVTNLKLMSKVMGEKSCNCVLLKVNQISSVTKSLQVCKLAQWGVMVSHCSGETEDTFIAELLGGFALGKTRLVSLADLSASYNQLLRIEEELGSKAKFAGRNFRHSVAN
ncbi:hypothetical protein HPG69_006538 [Diceros bicornis minor]|uniref:phosphopyruvate hydratase n=1 Tax=Diceros bicornis minor TaxID=77932 RepID=A0A7J7F5Q6_DICBM|nr:hypothetical protein HPG69_006538 [Diceros bicornis minor]